MERKGGKKKKKKERETKKRKPESLSCTATERFSARRRKEEIGSDVAAKTSPGLEACTEAGLRWEGSTRCLLSSVVARPCTLTGSASSPRVRDPLAADEREFLPGTFRAQLAGGDRTDFLSYKSLPSSGLLSRDAGTPVAYFSISKFQEYTGYCSYKTKRKS